MADEVVAAGPSNANPVPTMAMPWFMALPFIPKFSGKDGVVRFGTWVEQIESMLRAQGLDDQQKVDFVLWGLDGVAKRQVMLLDAATRGSSRAVLDELKKLYGQPCSLTHVRVQFFQCRQEDNESVEMYVLRFREILNRWKESEPQVVAQIEPTARDQFLKGLRPGRVQRKMERLSRQNPDLSFSEACSEAQALEKEQNRNTDTQTARVSAPLSTDMHELNRWKEDVKTELRQEMHDQLATISKTLVEEVRKQLTPPAPSENYQGQRQFPNSRVGPERYRQRPRPGGNFQWDQNGRPICRACGKSGHIQRYCNATSHPLGQNLLN